MKFSPEELGILTKAQEALSRPIRNCELVHEDYRRNSQGLVIFPNGLKQECPKDKQHFGCPHFLEFFAKDEKRRRISFQEVLELLRAKGMDVDELKQKNIELQSKAIWADSSMLGARTELHPESQSFPTAAEAKERAVPILQEFQEVKDTIGEPLRLKLLALVTQVLGEATVTS